MADAAEVKLHEKVATRALSYTVTAADGSRIFASAKRGQTIYLNDAQVARFEPRGSIADPDSPEAEAAQKPLGVGPGNDYMALDEAAELALRGSGALDRGGVIAEAERESLETLPDGQLRVIAGSLGLDTSRPREDLIAEIHAGTGAEGVASASQPKRRPGRPRKSESAG